MISSLIRDGSYERLPSELTRLADVYTLPQRVPGLARARLDGAALTPGAQALRDLLRSTRARHTPVIRPSYARYTPAHTPVTRPLPHCPAASRPHCACPQACVQRQPRLYYPLRPQCSMPQPSPLAAIASVSTVARRSATSVPLQSSKHWRQSLCTSAPRRKRRRCVDSANAATAELRRRWSRAH